MLALTPSNFHASLDGGALSIGCQLNIADIYDLNFFMNQGSANEQTENNYKGLQAKVADAVRLQIRNPVDSVELTFCIWIWGSQT